MTAKPNSNDDRAKVKNPERPEYAADHANRQKLGHGNLPPAPPAKPQPPAPRCCICQDELSEGEAHAYGKFCDMHHPVDEYGGSDSD
jgi:hypothetical protein